MTLKLALTAGYAAFRHGLRKRESLRKVGICGICNYPLYVCKDCGQAASHGCMLFLGNTAHSCPHPEHRNSA